MRKEDEKVIIYQTKDGETSIDVRLEGETVWLTANQMAVLFGRDVKTIRKHINNAIREELKNTMVSQKLRHPQNTVLLKTSYKYTKLTFII